MPNNEERTLEQPLMFKDKIEDDESELLWSAQFRHSKPRKRTLFFALTVLPWVLLILLGSWNLIQYQHRHARVFLNEAQQVYS